MGLKKNGKNPTLQDRADASHTRKPSLLNNNKNKEHDKYCVRELKVPWMEIRNETLLATGRIMG